VGVSWLEGDFNQKIAMLERGKVMIEFKRRSRGIG
jgi:hypothetical protein